MPITQHPITPAQTDIGLDGLNDVEISTPPVNGDVLTFNDSSSTWRPLASGGYLFQVGAFTNPGHYHYALMTMVQAQVLIQGTNPAVAVADPSQPSVVITSAVNGSVSPHTHDLTVFFDYMNHKFIVGNITNNTGPDLPHAAFLVADGDSAPSLLTSIVTYNPPQAMFVMRSAIADMQYYGAYSAVLGSGSAEWSGFFNQTPGQFRAGSTFPNAFGANLPISEGSPSDGNFIGTSSAGTKVACEMVVNFDPAQEVFVGYYATGAAPYSSTAPFASSQTFFASASYGVYTVGYGGVGNTGSLPQWVIGDVIGVAYNSSTARIFFFQNGVLVGSPSGQGVINSGGYIVCGAYSQA